MRFIVGFLGGVVAMLAARPIVRRAHDARRPAGDALPQATHTDGPPPAVGLEPSVVEAVARVPHVAPVRSLRAFGWLTLAWRIVERALEPARRALTPAARFIERHVIMWELLFGAFALLYIGLDIAFDTATGQTAETVNLLQGALTMVFALEFVGRLIAAQDRGRHLIRHAVDLLALLPPIRALRALRLIRLTRLFTGMYRAGANWEPLAHHRGFFTLVVAWLALGILCSLAVFSSERGVNPTVDDPIDALWWGVGALTTVGSDVAPQTLEGRAAAMILMLFGVFLFSAITATITTFLLRQSGSEEEADRIGYADEIERLVALREAGELTREEFASAKQLSLATIAIMSSVRRTAPQEAASSAST